MKQTMKQLLVCGMLVASIGSAVPAVAAESESAKENNPYAEQEARIHEVLQKVMEQHLNRGLDIQRLTDGAIRGLLEETGDPYTSYFNEEQFEAFYDAVEGTFSGIGVSVEQKGNALIIQNVFEDSSAAKAGIRVGDEILAVDGKDVAGKSFDQVTEWLKGEPGSTVSLTVKRGKREITTSLVRQVLQYSPVDSLMLDNKIGYMSLYTFSENSDQVFREHLARLQDGGMRGLILDLRDNPGGYLQAALNIADIFIGESPLVHIVDRSGKRTAVPSKPDSLKIPMVILVNSGTASASEVLTSALQDNRLAYVIGTKTYGKGVVQELIPLKKGGVLKLTVEEYLSPNLRKINEKGIMPDLIIENLDEQMLKAIAHLNGSTALRLFRDGTAAIAGFPSGNHVAKKIDGKWFIALRPFAGLYGYKIDWNATKGQVTLRYGSSSRTYSVKNNPHLRNEKGMLWISLDKLDQDFSSIVVEKKEKEWQVQVKQPQ